MRRIAGLVIALAIVLAACDSGAEPSTTTSTPSTTTSETTAPDPVEPDVVEWDQEVVDRVEALAGDGWTIETALEAATLIRAELERGVTAVDPLDVTGLAVYLAENFDAVPADAWTDLVGWEATGPARLVSFQLDEGTRSVLQTAVERVDEDFFARTGHRLNIPIHVALSDFDKPYAVFAATFVAGDNLTGFEFLFRAPAAYQAMADAVTDLAATSGQVCVIVLGQELLSWGGERQLGALMHEVTHCHQNVAHPQGPAGFRAEPALWMDEGYAMWAGESYVGGTLSSKPMWDEYLDRRFGASRDSFQVTSGSYRSFAFFWMLETGGIDVWGNFVPWFNGLRGNSVTDISRIRSMLGGVDAKVVSGWTASATRNNDFGSPWNSDNSPGIGNSVRSRNSTPQRVLGESTIRADEGEQRYRLMQVHTPPDEVSLITVDARGLGTLRWQYGDWSEQITVSGLHEQSWCVGEDCTCEDGTSPYPGVEVAPITAGERPDLHAAIFGGGTGAELTVSVQTLEEACEEEEVEAPSGPLDPCLFGTWNPDPQQFQDLILTLYRTIPGIADIALEGTIDLTFHDDGTFSHVYNGVQGSAVVDGQTFNATWTGGTYGRWEALGGLITLHFEGTDIVVNVGPLAGRAPPIPAESIDAPYDCGSTHIEFDPPATPGERWPLPEDWIKVS